VLTLEEQGHEVPAERARVTVLLEEIPDEIHRSVVANRQLISTTDPHGKDLPPTEESALLAETERIVKRILSLYQALQQDFELMQRFGIDPARERDRVTNALEEGTETLSVYLEIANDDAKSIVERLRVLPGDADLKARLDALLRFLRVLPFGEAEARAAARIRARLEGEGKPIGPLDVLVAATALEQQAVLVTHNTREFRRVTGLRVEDWY